ncbi:hypothetical protein NST07_23490 [Paenibacillus sp. FSL L8-0340]|uniref:hypothetical protein n=1 Tax=Paenibacillus sp. FSL L8-0340 TaxID=2954685 RepID=UPI003159817E
MTIQTQMLNVQKVNTVNITLKKPVSTVKQVSTEDILRLTETPHKAIVVSSIIDFFLKTDLDRQQFVTRWINGYKGNKHKSTAIMKLCKEIGSYNYIYNSYAELEQMDVFDALERLFLQPINEGMRMQYERLGASLRQLYDMKMNDPKLYFMTAMAFV